MSPALTAMVALALLAFLGAHVALLGAIFVRVPRWRGAVALAVPPLAPYWGWRYELRGRVYVWLSALVLYGIGVAILAR